MVASLQSYVYKVMLEAAHKVTWHIEDMIGGDKCLDFSSLSFPNHWQALRQSPV